MENVAIYAWASFMKNLMLFISNLLNFILLQTEIFFYSFLICLTDGDAHFHPAERNVHFIKMIHIR